MHQRIVFAMVLVLLSSQLVSAHDTWVEEHNGDLVVIYGHGNEHDPYDPSQVKDAKGVNAKGRSVAVPLLNKNGQAVLDTTEKPAMVAWIFDGGYHVKTTDGWKAMRKSQAQKKYQILEAVKGEKYCKAYLAKLDAWSKPVGHPLEIVPQKDPMTLKVGDLLPIVVLFQGKPLEAAEIVTGQEKKPENKLSLKTDKKGQAELPLSGNGWQFIAVRHRPQIDGDPEADALALSAAITFALK